VIGRSPAQLLLGRVTRSDIPCTDAALSHGGLIDTQTGERRRRLQQRQKVYHDRTAHGLAPLRAGESVMIQPLDKYNRQWIRGTVLEQISRRSYKVKSADKIYTRNRRFLRPTYDADTSARDSIFTEEVPTVVNNEDALRSCFPPDVAQPAEVTGRGGP